MLDKNEIKRLVTQCFYIVLSVTIIAFTVNLFHPKGFEFASRESLYSGIFFISADEAKIKYDSSSAIFIDSREEHEFAQSHIKDAINIPAVPDFMCIEKIKTNKSLIYSPKEIVIYCDKNCGTAEKLAGILTKEKYPRHLYIIKNGLPEWEMLKYPVDK